jgi:hypothetical protein
MATVVFFVFVVVVTTVAAFDHDLSVLRQWWRRARQQEAAPPLPPDPVPPERYAVRAVEPGTGFEADGEVDRRAQREEMRLVTLLLDGQLPAVWYRQRMAEIAAADAARHPVAPPPPRTG